MLVDGLGYDDSRIIRPKIQKQRTAVTEHRDELLIPYPGGIEEYVVAEMADFVDNLTGIINAAVICAELDDRHADRTFCFRFYGIFFGNEFADIFFVKAVFKNAADRTESVSCRFQIYRGWRRREQEHHGL